MPEPAGKPEPTEHYLIEIGRAQVANNWAKVANNLVEGVVLLAMLALVAQCSTGAIW